MDIHRSQIKDFVLPKVKSSPVIDYFEGIQGLLASREEFPYRDFLANPKVRTQNEIIWSSDSFTESPKLLSQLTGQLKDRYIYTLNSRIRAFCKVIDNLSAENGENELTELLRRTIAYIDDVFVYCGDGEVVLVNWGMIPRVQSNGSGSIVRKGHFVGSWITSEPVLQLGGENATHVGYEKENPTLDKTGQIQAGPIPQVPPITEEVPASVMTISEPIDKPVLVTDSLSANLPATENYEKGANPTRQEESDGLVSQAKPENNQDQSHDDREKNDIVTKKPDNDHQENWGTFFTGLVSGIAFLFKKLWWLIMLIVLFLGLSYILRGCQGPLSAYNPFYSPLPEHPWIMPIDNNSVTTSEDGLTQIASDRINVMLDKKNDETMLEFAKAFKREYPGYGYEITYYNEEFYTLQIKIPAEDHKQIKREIKEKLKDFDFDVYDEQVFSSNFIPFNDPELSSNDHAWYVKATNTDKAWAITTGDSSLIVAIVDNGFDLSHPELSGKTYHPYNVLSQDNSVRPIITDEGEDAHGTHVAATAVGNGNNSQGLLGIAPGCKLMPVQVANDNPSGSMSGTAIIEGALYAINHGADVINISLGLNLTNDIKSLSENAQLNYISNSFKQEELLWKKIIDKANQRNCIIVFAAGNDNVVSGLDPKKRNSDAIIVSAANPDVKKAYFSNYGRYPELNRYYSTVTAPGVSIYNAAPNNSYISIDGTSMAAPIVTGAVALIKSVNKNLTHNQVISFLQNTGVNIDSSIGPFININSAVRKAGNISDETETDCERIGELIKYLKGQIDSLTRICPDAGEPEDTLKFKEVVKDKRNLNGLWKTTTQLCSDEDRSPIELYMKFNNLSGKLIIKNNGNVFTAPLKAKIKKDKIYISQSAKAKSKTSKSTFEIYQYECSEDRNGNLNCFAKCNKSSVNFNLVRIKQ